MRNSQCNYVFQTSTSTINNFVNNITRQFLQHKLTERVKNIKNTIKILSLKKITIYTLNEVSQQQIKQIQKTKHHWAQPTIQLKCRGKHGAILSDTNHKIFPSWPQAI